MARINRREFLVTLGGVAALTAVGAVGGCSSPSSPATSAPPSQDAAKTDAGSKPAPSSKGPTTVRVHINTGAYSDFVKKWGEKFTKEEKPDIKISVEPFTTAGNEYHAKIRAMHNTGEIGDLAWTWATSGQLPELGHLGLWQPVDEMVKADKLDLGAYYPSAIAGLKYQNKLLGLPFHAHPGFSQFIYNKDIFEKAGVALPDDKWTWDTVTEAAKKTTVRDGDKVKQFGWMSLTLWHAYVIWARIYGGDLLSEDGKKSLLDTAEFRKGIQWIYDMQFIHKSEPRTEQIEGSQIDMFTVGRVAMYHIDSTSIPSMPKRVETKFKWGVQLLPAGPGGQRSALTTPHIIGITAKSKARDGAWEFLKSITSKEAGVTKGLDGAGAPGGRPDSWTDERMLKYAPDMKTVAQAFEWARPERTPANYRGIETADAVDQNIANIWTGSVDVEKGTLAAHQAVQRALDKPAD
jgi:multiple sugar transport system substrate-binding protein